MNKIHLCEYGCGQEAKYQMKNGKWCCSKKTNSCPKIRKKNSDGLKVAYKTGKLNAKMNYFNQSKESKEKQAWSKGKCLLDLDKVFRKNTRWSSGMIKKYLLQFKIKNEQCDICKLTTWNNKKIPLECHHIDGDSKNNSIENLQLLCLNCHAQTSNFRGRNISRTKNDYVSDKEIICALKKTKNIRQALIYLELAPKGGNYIRLEKIKKQYNL